MSARFFWTVQDANGNAVPGVTVTLHDPSDDSLIGTMTGVGDGSYTYDVATSRKLRVKENGTTKLDNYWHPADDSAIASTLASGSGASLIGCPEITSQGFPEVTLWELLYGHIASYNVLADTASGRGASLIGVYDVAGHYSTSDVEAVLAEIGAVFDLLNGLTADAGEVNVLDGITADVTTAALNALCSGAIANVHLHDRDGYKDDAIGNALNPGEDSGPLHFRIFSSNGGGADPSHGNIVLDVFNADGSGKVYVRTGDDSDAQTDYEVITAYEIGDLNLSSNTLFNGLSDASKVTNALLRLAGEVRNAQVTAGIAHAVIDFLGTSAASSSGSAAADPTTTVAYTQSGTTYVRKRRAVFVQKPEHRYLTVWVYGAFATGATSGGIKIMVDTAEAEAVITSTATKVYKMTIDLGTVPVTVDTERTLDYYLKGDGSVNASYIYSWIQARISIT